MGDGLSEIEIARAGRAVFLPGANQAMQGSAHATPLPALARFGLHTPSIGLTAAPLFPQLGIASLLVAVPTATLKNLNTG